jgi:Prenyltransferase and squalene oxidase repeat
VRRRFSVDFEPLRERLQIRSWVDHLRRDLSTGGFGVMVSLVLHAIVMIVLALIVYQVRVVGDGDPLIASWLTPGEKAANAGRKRTPIALPINIGSLPSQATVDKTPSDSGDPDARAKVGVAPVDVSQALESRNPRTRADNLERLGGSPDAERAIKSGLQWLSRQQKSDGHWELHQGYPDAGFSTIKTDTGATALALLAMLGHGNTHQTGEFSASVAKGLKWLRTIQDPATGDLHDMRAEEGRQPSFYAHSMATIALCEALALTSDNELKPAAERAVKYLLDAQHPDNGGWKYRPINKQMVGDLSVTGWALMALHTARMAGIDVQQEDFVRASSFLDSVQAKGSARYKYEPTSPDSKATAALTAEALLCRQWLGWPRNFPEMVQGTKYVMADENLPGWSGGRRNVYAWYYTSQMLHNLGGDDWKRWNTAVRDVVVRNQVTGGSAKAGQDTRGSWHPTAPPGDPHEYGEKGGRLYITALCILILETPYRHQPIYGAGEVAATTAPDK